MPNTTLKRREFLKNTGASASLFIPLLVLDSSPVVAQDFPLIEESNASALSLGYKHSASDVDLSKFPQRGTDAGKAQFCSNCSLYTGSTGASTGPCAIFPAKSVATTGWCSVWTQKSS